MSTLLGNQLTRLRLLHHLSAGQLAEQIEIPASNYIQMEKGMRSISLDVLDKLAEFYKTSIGDITEVLEGETNDSSQPVGVIEIVKFLCAHEKLYQKLELAKTGKNK